MLLFHAIKFKSLEKRKTKKEKINYFEEDVALKDEQGISRLTCFIYFWFSPVCIRYLYEFTYLTFLGAKPKPSVVYFYFEPKHFKRFNDFNNETMDFIHRFENKQETKQRTNAVSVDVIVKIGVVGNFSEDNLKLFPKGKVTFKKLRYFKSYVVV